MSNRDDRIRRDQVRLARWRCRRRQFLGRAGALLGGARDRARRCSPRAGGSSGGSTSSSAVGGGTQGRRDLELDRATSTKQSKTTSPRTPGSALTYDEDINDNNEYFAKIRPNLSKHQSIGTRRLRPHRLDGEPDDQPGEVGAAVRRRRSSRTRRTCARALKSPGLRPDPRSTARRGRAASPASRTTSKITERKEIRRSTTSSRSRGRRRCSPRCATRSGSSCVAEASTPRSRPTPTAQPRVRQAAEGRVQRRQDRRLQRQRVRGRPRRTATSPPRSRGRATSRRSRRTTRTCGSRSRTRAGCSGPDNFMIPYDDGQGRPRRAELINYFYDPKNAAVLTAGIQYISPVERRHGRAHRDGRRRREAGRQPACEPDRRVPRPARDLRAAEPGRRSEVRQAVLGDPGSG